MKRSLQFFGVVLFSSICFLTYADYTYKFLLPDNTKKITGIIYAPGTAFLSLLPGAEGSVTLPEYINSNVSGPFTVDKLLKGARFQYLNRPHDDISSGCTFKFAFKSPKLSIMTKNQATDPGATHVGCFAQPSQTPGMDIDLYAVVNS